MIYSLKSMAGSLGFIDNTTKKTIDMKDVAEENIVYACTVSLENGVAKIEATISFKSEWLSGVSAGEGVSVKNFDMKVIYAFTADKISDFESLYNFTMVEAEKETASISYSNYEFDTNFNQSLFNEIVAVEATCPAYEGTVDAIFTKITVYNSNGEEHIGHSVYVPYDDKDAAKTVIDQRLAVMKSNLKDAVNVKAYLDEACTIEYTEDNKNDLVMDCCDGAKIYFKVTPVDDTKTVVYTVYKVSNPIDSYIIGSKTTLVDKTNEYKITTETGGKKYEDKITVNGTVLADGVTTVDLTGKDSVTIVCTRND